MPISKEDAGHARWALEIVEHMGDKADAAAITCDEDKVVEFRAMESGFRQLGALFERMIRSSEFDPSETTDAERKIAADVWEAAAALIESGTSPEVFVDAARKSASALRGSISLRDATLDV